MDSLPTRVEPCRHSILNNAWELLHIRGPTFIYIPDFWMALELSAEVLDEGAVEVEVDVLA